MCVRACMLARCMSIPAIHACICTVCNRAACFFDGYYSPRFGDRIMVPFQQERDGIRVEKVLQRKPYFVPVQVCYQLFCTSSPTPLNALYANASSDKKHLYELVYFCKPKNPDGTGLLFINIAYACMCVLTHALRHPNKYHLYAYLYSDETSGDQVLRFKDGEACLSILKKFVQGRKRCLLTRAIYLQAEVSNLCINDYDTWRVTSCRPKFRRDQIAKGLATLDGVDEKAGRRLAYRIPAREYPAPIKAIKKYCCKNFCRACRGARLHGDIQVKGFKARRKGVMEMMTLEQYSKPKKDECEWRLAKRRTRNEAGVLQPRGWLNVCVECSGKYKVTFAWLVFLSGTHPRSHLL